MTEKRAETQAQGENHMPSRLQCKALQRYAEVGIAESCFSQRRGMAFFAIWALKRTPMGLRIHF